MTNQQGAPEALRLADLLLNLQTHMGPRRPSHPDDAHCWDGYTQSSAELRRLHAQVAALTAAPQGVAYAELPEPDQAAESVLEDAARLDWIALAGPVSICVVIDRPHDGEVEVATDDVTGYGKTLREALDAARKQGGA